MPKVFSSLLFILSLSACNHEDNHKNGYFKYNQIDGIESLDPAFAKSLSVMWAVSFMYNTLVEVDEQLDLKPSLAKSWSISNDGLTYTFDLQNNVYFHDNPVFENGIGRKMTAADVVYSFERLVHPQTASAGAWVFNDRIAENKPFMAINDSTFVIKLKQPFRPLLEILSMSYCSIVPREVVEKWGKDFRNHPCGTGPFQFSFWDEGNILMFKKNEHYWEKDEYGVSLPYLQGIEVSFNETRALEFLRFRQKELDFINGIDGAMQDLVLTKRGELRPEFEDEMNMKKRVYLNTEYLGFNLSEQMIDGKENPYLDKKIRKAINYAIDKQKIVTYFRNGIGVPANRGFIPKGMRPEIMDKFQYEYNPQQALKLLEEAGYPLGKNLPTLLISSPDANVDICNFVAASLKDIGINAQVQILQKGILRQEMSNSNLLFFKAQWIADYPDEETFLAFFYSKFPAPPNYTRYKNAYYDKKYEESLQTLDDERRRNLYQEMDDIIIEDLPVIPLYYDEVLHFTQKSITGFSGNALNMIDLKRVKKINVK